VSASRVHLLAVLTSSVLALLGSGAAQATSPVTGLSDQRMARFDGNLGEWTPTVQRYATNAASQIKQARYQVRWDVALLPTTDRAVVELDAWLRAAQTRGYRPLITFMPSARGDQPSRAAYQAAVAQFRINWPQVTEFTPWNEPNHSDFSVPASSAVDYLQALLAVCGSSCTVAAGDFSGSRTEHTYYRDYKGLVDARGLAPRVWAYHPYEVVNNGTASDRFDGLRAFLALTGSADVWFTEVGAYYCQGGTYYGPSAQNDAALRLRALISSPSHAAYNRRLKRVYYYHFSGDWHPGGPCFHDSGLVNHQSVDGGGARPALTTLLLQAPVLTWQLRNSNSPGPVDAVTATRGGIAVTGDWDGDGVDTPGVFVDGFWHLNHQLAAGPAPDPFEFGAAGMVPLVGDWNGDGRDTIGVYEPAVNAFHLRNSNSAGPVDIYLTYGFSGGIPVVGDWNGDGRDTIGMWNPSTAFWYLRNTNTTGVSDVAFEYGWSGGRPVVGDWNGDGVDTIGMFDRANGIWHMRNSNTFGPNSYTFSYGASIHTPLVGDWDGTGTDTPGVTN